jgi:hypothetical protein
MESKSKKASLFISEGIGNGKVSHSCQQEPSKENHLLYKEKR